MGNCFCHFNGYEVKDATARKQLAAAQNVNYLDNSDFTNPVNQRGETAYSGGPEYTIDRWKTTNNKTTLTITENGINLAIAVEETAGYFLQIIDRPQRLFGKIVTLAACTNDGRILCAACKIPTEFPDQNTVLSTLEDDGINCGGVMITNSGIWIRIWANGAEGSREFKWAALYEGNFTAETLPEYSPKGYGAELAECQRYYQIRSTNAVDAVDLRPTMRLSAPTITEVTGGYSYSADL